MNPSITPALREEIAFLEGTIEPLGNGYARVVDGVELLQTLIVATDEVAPAENDAYLSIFSHENMGDPEAASWFRQWLAQEVTIMGNPAKIKDFDDMLRKLYDMLPPEEIMRRTGLKPETLLPAMTLEQRLAGLSSEERLEGLSNKEILAGRSRADLERLIEEARRLVDEAE